MSLLFSSISFCVQLVAIASIISIIISCVFSSSIDSALVGEDHPSGAVVSVDEDGYTSFNGEPCSWDDFRLSMITADYYDDENYLEVLIASYTTIDEPVSIAEDLGSLTIRQLKALCRERHIKRYSSLRKHELIALLSEF